MYTKRILNIALFVLILVPIEMHAFNVYTEKNSEVLTVGRPANIRVLVDTKGEEINVIEGTISAAPELGLSDVETGGSAFVLWPEKPTVNKTDNSVSFVGGSQGGFYGKDLRVFDIILIPQKEGHFTIKSENLSAYLNDGNGKKIDGDLSGFNFDVVLNSNDNVVKEENDKLSPDNLVVEIGKDDSMFSSQYFLAFYATDSDSGISRYEIKEGDSNFEVCNNQNYIIKDQSLNTNVWIKVVDKDGNELIKKVKPYDLLNNNKSNDNNILTWIIPIIVILIFVFVFLRLIRSYIRKIKNKKTTY